MIWNDEHITFHLSSLRWSFAPFSTRHFFFYFAALQSFPTYVMSKFSCPYMSKIAQIGIFGHNVSNDIPFFSITKKFFSDVMVHFEFWPFRVEFSWLLRFDWRLAWKLRAKRKLELRRTYIFVSRILRL